MAIENTRDLQLELKNITFAPSCVDIGWDWEVDEVFEGPHFDAEFIGWRLRTTFQRPDTDTGEVGPGRGRWWLVERGVTQSALVKTAWLACKQIVEHELMEAFMYRGVRPFDPHVDVNDLCRAMNDAGASDA